MGIKEWDRQADGFELTSLPAAGEKLVTKSRSKSVKVY